MKLASKIILGLLLIHPISRGQSSQYLFQTLINTEDKSVFNTSDKRYQEAVNKLAKLNQNKKYVIYIHTGKYAIHIKDQAIFNKLNRLKDKNIPGIDTRNFKALNLQLQNLSKHYPNKVEVQKMLQQAGEKSVLYISIMHNQAVFAQHDSSAVLNNQNLAAKIIYQPELWTYSQISIKTKNHQNFVQNYSKDPQLLKNIEILSKQYFLNDKEGWLLETVNAIESVVQQNNNNLKDVKILKTSVMGKKMLRFHEGCSETAGKNQRKWGYLYEDSKGYCTFGIGHLIRKDNCTQADIDQYSTQNWNQVLDDFDQTIKKYENYVQQYVKVPVTQEEFDAMVSFCFNVGPGNPQGGRNAGFSGSRFLQSLNKGERNSNLLLNFKDNPNRRESEVTLFTRGEYTINGKNNLNDYKKLPCNGK